MPQQPPAVYHYCPRAYLRPISAAGEIRPSAEGGRHGERGAVRFTSSPLYEPTAVKLTQDHGSPLRQMTIEEQERRFGLARIAVDPAAAPLTWADWVRDSGVRPADVKRMTRRAKAVGSDVGLYRASWEPVTDDRWLAVEVWKGGRWVSGGERGG